MSRKKFVTETIDCGGENPTATSVAARETAFERPRGVSRIEIRTSFAQVHVSDLQNPIEGRIRILEQLKHAGISLDFLKFTPTGMSFLVSEPESDAMAVVLDREQVTYTIRTGRSIVLVYAVNIRDEEGLIARIVQEAVTSGTRVDHIGDGHDRMLLVVAAEDASRLHKHFETTLLGA